MVLLKLSASGTHEYRILTPNENLYKLYDDSNLRVDPDDDGLEDDDLYES